MKSIALFGGSFNPPHPGHFDMAQYIYETLEVDEVWFLFSKNWQKDSSKYVSTEHRMEMGRILGKHYPDMPFVMSNIEEELGTHITSDVLDGLKRKFPEDRFIWTMGADNLESFHTWDRFEHIIENFSIAVVDRPSYTEGANASFTAHSYAHLKVEDVKSLGNGNVGWSLLDNPRVDISSSSLLAQLFNGTTKFDTRFQDVADYIKEHNLYEIHGASKGVGGPGRT